MKVSEQCYKCKNFLPARYIGSAPEGEMVAPECIKNGAFVSPYEECEDFEEHIIEPYEWEIMEQEYQERLKKARNEE